MYQKIRPLLFKMDAEKAHSIVLYMLKYGINYPFFADILAKIGSYQSPRLSNTICGLDFYNPIGLAAGFDKDGQMIRGLCALGFGYLELGTVTKIPQIGNPRPRIFRHIQEESLQNTMGFNNMGSFALASRIKKYYPFVIPLGINVGKSREIAQSDALLNYEKALEDVLAFGDYFVFNLSSPNTPQLRDLQNVKFVNELFSMGSEKTTKPIFLKISPDMPNNTMLKVCEKAIDSGASGIIATNTTTDYSLLTKPESSGGISGRVLKEKSEEVFLALAKAFFNKSILISVGGICDGADMYRRVRMGASLVQLYTSLIFDGPGVCRHILKEFDALLVRDGFEHISQAIGVDL